MITDDDIEQPMEPRICFNCVGEDFLKGLVSDKGRGDRCSYCGGNTKCLSIEELSELIEIAFDQHYYQTSDQPTPYQSAMQDGYWLRDGYPVINVIMDAAGIPEEAASEIQRILEGKFSDRSAYKMGEETEFCSGSYYEQSGVSDVRWQNKWSDFEHSLKTEARFFNRFASHFLASVFDGIDTMQTRDGRSLIVDAGPGTEYSEVFRARSFQFQEKLEDALTRPDKHLGSPPPTDASAGRMNAHGISVFYGANSPMAALAEVRPPVGSQVAVARFDIIRQARLLDLTALSDVSTSGSIFDPSFINRLERTMFLRNLIDRITIPVMPDHETFEYLATQAIADFLSAKNDSNLDGIIFPSNQTRGAALNFILFRKAARIEAIELPKGTEFWVRSGTMYEEGWERDYSVHEEVPAKKENPKSQEDSVFEVDKLPPDLDERPSTLKIDLDSVRVHTVDSVEFNTSEYPVRRYRSEKRDTEF